MFRFPNIIGGLYSILQKLGRPFAELESMKKLLLDKQSKQLAEAGLSVGICYIIITIIKLVYLLYYSDKYQILYYYRFIYGANRNIRCKST